MSASPAALLIAGPTAAGKSALAARIAAERGGAVVNADAMQVYREWRILTARPDEAACRRVPHRLYGHRSLRSAGSVGSWLRDLGRVLDELRAAGRLPVITGGTGAYFRALTEGLAELPPVDPDIRREVADRLGRAGVAALAADLARRDPATAAAIDRDNPRRVARAWEVLEQTGRGLAAWHADTPPPLLPADACRCLLLAPPREPLRRRIADRFRRMLAEGVVEEARAVWQSDVPPSLPGMRALGAAELFAHLDGRLSEDEAAATAITRSQAYARRQMTWFRNRMPGWFRTEDADSAATRDWLQRLPAAGGEPFRPRPVAGARPGEARC